MIAVLIIWTYIFFITFTYGLMAYRITSALRITPQTSVPVTVPVLSLAGLCIIMCFLGYYSLFFKIGAVANLILFLPAAMYYFYNREKYTVRFKNLLQSIYNMPRGLLFVATMYIGLVLLLSLITPQSYDTGLYHAQAIQWIERYKVIPGLGNLLLNLAYNSHFFLPSALFSFSFLNIQPVHLLNSYLVLLLVSLMLKYISRSRETMVKCLLIYVPLLVLPFYFFRYSISSPETDLPAAILVWFIFLAILQKIINNSQRVFDFNYLAVFIIIFSMLVIKISTTVVFLLLPYILFVLRKSLRISHILILLSLVLLIILPWLVRNAIISGYLTIALPSIDIFNFDWKIPRSLLIDIRDTFRSWAMIPHRDTAEVFAMSFSKWFLIWFKALSAVEKMVFLVLVTSPVYLGLKFIFQPRKFFPNIHFIILWLICLLGVSFWFFIAPDFRYGLGFLFFGCLLAIFLLFQDILAISLYRLTIIVLFLCGIFGLLMGLSIAKRQNLVFSKCWLEPQGYRRVETVRKALGRFTVLAPKKGDQCWNEPIPCTPYFNERIELRGENFSSGFRLRKK